MRQQNKGHNGTGVYCGCCGDELLCVIKPQESLEVKDHRHGQHHVATLTPREVLERISGTSGREGVLNFVRRVL